MCPIRAQKKEVVELLKRFKTILATFSRIFQSEPSSTVEPAGSAPKQSAPANAPDQFIPSDQTAHQERSEQIECEPAAVIEPTFNDSSCIDDLHDDVPPDVFAHIRDPQIMGHYISLDIETTGLNRDKDKIIEIAAIHYVYGVESKRFHTYVNPQMPIPKHIANLTGIQQADVDAAPVIEDIAWDFRNFLKDYPVVGHNVVKFDWPFLTAHMTLNDPPLLIDTLDMVRTAFPLLPSHKLANLNYWFDLDPGSSHRADADAAATNALLWACLYPDQYERQYQMAIQCGIPKTGYDKKQKSLRRFQKISTSDIVPEPGIASAAGPLCGKRIVFTGELSISRTDAMQLAVNAGALLRTSVSSKTDFLVVGEQDLSVVGADGMSSKEEKAHELNDLGKGCVKIINEAQFIDMLKPASNSDSAN